MNATEIAGFAGAGLAGAAYVPQIAHLVRARCSAGISQLAFAAWLLSSVLLCAARYQDKPCPSHSPARPGPRQARPTGQRLSRSSAVSQGRG